MAVRTKPPINSPLHPPDLRQEEAWAIKALHAGTADAAEQGLVWRFLIFKLAEFDGLHYRDNDRDTNFSLGRHFVGQQLLQIAGMAPEAITKLRRLYAGPSGEDDEIHNM